MELQPSFTPSPSPLAIGTQARGNIQRTNQWTFTQEVSFIEFMLEEINNSRGVQGGFQREAWERMTQKMVALYGDSFDRERLKNKHKLLRNMYRDIKKLTSVSGFKWDGLRSMVTAEKEVWDDYLKENPWATKFQNKGLLDLNSLDRIFGGAIADGRRRDTVGNAVPLDNTPVADVGGTLTPLESPQIHLLDGEAESSPLSNTGRSSSSRSKRPRPNTPISRTQKKKQGIASEHVAAAMIAMADSIREMMALLSPNPQIQMKECMDAVEELFQNGEVDLDDVMKASGLFQDSSKAHMFLALRPKYRRMFLERELAH
ncbi:hypothetical protein AMTR_s00092p00067380 [Amborella trichopoda]|uniref:Myb/SANT-like domain-containing protein n=3 Tax=Amborella trichopoda TaxID=13333 RepID=W1NQJ4_AMBTC|nr:hypothetical protein AMTR_s00092p00067380 [Amborella trichopoda]